jgi:HEAT repeat protein
MASSEKPGSTIGHIQQHLRIKSLIRQLSDTEKENRQAAIVHLAEIGLPAVPHLVKALTSTNPITRGSAAAALGEMAGLDTAPRPLIEMLHDNDAQNRRIAAWALGEIKDAAAAALLREELANPEAGVREKAARALGWIADAAAAPLLRGALADPDTGVREAAAWALGKIGDTAAAPLLRAAMADPVARVRLYAA